MWAWAWCRAVTVGSGGVRGLVLSRGGFVVLLRKRSIAALALDFLMFSPRISVRVCHSL